MKTYDSYRGPAVNYNQFRPSPPPAFTEILLTLAQVDRVGLVIDMGSGTGLSTRPWADYAERIIGIEPNTEYLEVARTCTSAENITYIEGISSQVPVESGSADIVTTVQSLHWMEPAATFKEVKRILKPNGLFAMLVQTKFTFLSFPINTLWDNINATAVYYYKDHGYDKQERKWGAEEITREFNKSGNYTDVLDTWLAEREKVDAQRIMGRLHTMPWIVTSVQDEFAPVLELLEELEKLCKRVIGKGEVESIISYLLQVGIKSG